MKFDTNNHAIFKKDILTIDERVWECPNCHRLHNRDINASINLKQEGLRIYKEIK
jgi:putative transposase